MDTVVAKMQRCKPFVFDGTEVAVEEAKRMWSAVKETDRQEQ